MKPDQLWGYAQRACDRTPDAVALVVANRTFNYRELQEGARSVSASVQGSAGRGPFVGLFAYRSFGAYAGVLGILRAGKAYVPLDPHQPTERLARIAALAELDVIIADEPHAAAAIQLGRELPVPPKVVVIGTPGADPGPLPEGCVPATDASSETPVVGDHAYMLFTSGSTGVPKGVPIRHRNVIAYVEHLRERFAPTAEDRFSQTFELTFDLSVHDLFLCWSAGAALHVIPREELMAPARFIREHALTQWFSVPSTAMLMERMRQLKPGAFPSLRISAFCGEPLPAELAVKWAQATPNGRVVNLYGPTEATIAIAEYDLDPARPKSRHGILSIGQVFPGSSCAVLDADGHEANIGELLLGGPQVTDGYWRNAERTEAAFVTRGDQTYYRTGDIVERDADGDLFFIARTDDQVKVRGHRIELQEVAYALKAASGAAFAYPLAHPVREGIALGIEAFLPEAHRAERDMILARCAELLPEYMVPTRLHFIDEVPFTTSGKADMKALRARL